MGVWRRRWEGVRLHMFIRRRDEAVRSPQSDSLDSHQSRHTNHDMGNQQTKSAAHRPVTPTQRSSSTGRSRTTHVMAEKQRNRLSTNSTLCTPTFVLFALPVAEPFAP